MLTKAKRKYDRVTLCHDCDELLTKNGVRYEAANFDSGAWEKREYRRKNTKFITYALCDTCHTRRTMTVAKAKRNPKSPIYDKEKYDHSTILEKEEELSKLYNTFGVSDEEDISDIIDGNMGFDGY